MFLQKRSMFELIANLEKKGSLFNVTVFNCSPHQPVKRAKLAALKYQVKAAVGVGWQDDGEGGGALQLRTIHL